MKEKFKRELKWLFLGEVNFGFYAKSGIYGMYSFNRRNYYVGIPLLIGFRYTISWGSYF